MGYQGMKMLLVTNVYHRWDPMQGGWGHITKNRAIGGSALFCVFEKEQKGVEILPRAAGGILCLTLL